MFAPYVPQSGGPSREVSMARNMTISSPRGLNAPTMVAAMTEDEIENIMENFAKEDTYFKKTWSRIVVEKFLGKMPFYFPRKDRPSAPSLSKAYAYYEHVTLPRHFSGDGQADHALRRSEPGESFQPTELYSPFTTPASALVEWGIGVDLYFSTLRILAGILFCVGVIHLPNVRFYRTDYSENDKEMRWGLQGSAICTTTEWVVCVDCSAEQWNTADEQLRFGTTEDEDGTTVLVQRNDCNFDLLPLGIVNLVGLIFLTVVFFILSFYLRAREVRFDEDKVTSTDYSIVVKNPPKDAYDPDEWRDYFSQFAEKQVTAVTVALNNEKMLRFLIARRRHRNNLRLMLPKGIDMDDEEAVRTEVAQLVRDRSLESPGCLSKIISCTVIPIFNVFDMMLPPETLVDRVFWLTDQIKELQTEKYDVCKVFVTFETEEGQRAALSALKIGRLDAMMGNKAACAPSALFRGNILLVDEPAEPSAVRWLDLSASNTRKNLMRGLNLLVTILVVTFAGYVVDQTRYSSLSWLAAPLITAFNTIIPLIVKILMIFEPHGTEGSFQASLYMKITAFRWVNTALLPKLITPWSSTLSAGDRNVIPQINALLWSELFLTPALRLLDLWGNFQKHILAPRARTQEQMNLNFQGTKYNLGERYTDLTKVLFLCFYYSVLQPAAFFFGTAILLVQYHTDKFCLMRIWGYSPSLGSEVAQFSRRYFFSGAILAYAIISAYAWAGFPYDNLCTVEDDSKGSAAGNYTNVIIAGDMDEKPQTIPVSQPEFVKFCGQNWRAFVGFAFPPVSEKQPSNAKWMTEDQEMLTNIYGWTSLAFLVGFIALFFGSGIVKYFQSWFRGVYENRGQKQEIDFSSNAEIFAYVPQIKVGGFPFPFLACDIDYIDQGLIGWNDPAHSYDVHNLIFDVPWKGQPRKKIIEGNTRGTALIREHEEYSESSGLNVPENEAVAPEDVATPRLFSTIKHYPPPWALQVRASASHHPNNSNSNYVVKEESKDEAES